MRLSKILLCVIVVLCFVTVHFIFFRAPSEINMIHKFHQRKGDFEQIRLMLKEDKNVATIGSFWVTGKWSEEKGELSPYLSTKRLALYRSRLKDLGFSRVDSDDGYIQLEQFGGGFTDTSWGIGYIWSATTPVPIVKSAYNQRPPQNTWCYSRIEGNWYIYQRR